MTPSRDHALNELTTERHALRAAERLIRLRDEGELERQTPQDRGQRLRRASAGLDELLRRS